MQTSLDMEKDDWLGRGMIVAFWSWDQLQAFGPVAIREQLKRCPRNQGGAVIPWLHAMPSSGVVS